MGDVAVTADGHTHAVAVADLEGDIEVDVDAGTEPRVRLPTDVCVSYVEDALETDGGVSAHTRSRVDGYGLAGKTRDYAMAGAMLLASVAGWLWASAGGGMQFAALVTASAAAGLGVIAYRSAAAGVSHVGE
ncbi:hypothetical protein NKF06_12800 [Haloferax sp. AB510]|uniref:hypothetical protein n=1 Tax=Haloferax sp. AB510 TaxID=2934172 RepID=UPI00209BC34E|nr:hypothetical protein [Haloferax sp. AB510]MCO8267442.1 hypothetical protein [Haloferax sp. AB510]